MNGPEQYALLTVHFVPNVKTISVGVRRKRLQGDHQNAYYVTILSVCVILCIKMSTENLKAKGLLNS